MSQKILTPELVEIETTFEESLETVEFSAFGRNRDRDRERDRECDGCGKGIASIQTVDSEEFIV